MDLLERAGADADAAATRAGVTCRELHTEAELSQAREVWDVAWPSTIGGTELTPNLARALAHAGSYLSGAYEQDRMVGATLALLGRRRTDSGWRTYLHSHMAATFPGFADRGIGSALKLRQRAWALDNDIETIEWTFDPLVRRNARLNLVKLGAEVREYLVDFYGEMPDEVNAGDPSDRLIARWELGSTRVDDAVSGRVIAPSSAVLIDEGAVRALVVDGDAPRPTGQSAQVTLVPLPADIVALRRDAPALAAAWRTAVRQALVPLLEAGACITSLTVEGDYVVEGP